MCSKAGERWARSSLGCDKGFEERSWERALLLRKSGDSYVSDPDTVLGVLHAGSSLFLPPTTATLPSRELQWMTNSQKPQTPL